jgi:hypothetical protein
MNGIASRGRQCARDSTILLDTFEHSCGVLTGDEFRAGGFSKGQQLGRGNQHRGSGLAGVVLDLRRFAFQGTDEVISGLLVEELPGMNAAV